MTSKIVTTLGRQVVRKIGKSGLTKIFEKVDEPFATFNREIFGIMPLIVGEMEELRCYSRHPNSTSKCNELGLEFGVNIIEQVHINHIIKRNNNV